MTVTVATAAVVVTAVVVLVLVALAPLLARGVPADVVAAPGSGRGGAPRVLVPGPAAEASAAAPGARHLAVVGPARHRADAHDLAA
ncbi:hypothetical protein [Pseudokineococcus lusitanus]|uniref:Uncharacterized protein n=1 Tax=Pseudokineococcus lusitanus TaxID=763993 RepID=A0A3N1GWW4_9ACTN|nr:hypothetical protein [Pseudokineococcus lusitanus]ROP34771.1 hypothetical protein EDC03_2593 [Pseudokineococcus lusitanus]